MLPRVSGCYGLRRGATSAAGRVEVHYDCGGKSGAELGGDNGVRVLRDFRKRRGHDWHTRCEILEQLEWIDLARPVILHIRDDANVDRLDVGGELRIRPWSEQMDVRASQLVERQRDRTD